MKSSPDLPIPISLISGRYFLFSADVVSYLRREQRICGVLIGSIPQIPQQNVFLGLPLELMPEEAQLLVAKDVAYIVDDVRAHDEALRSSLDQSRCQRRHDYLASLREAGEQAAKSQAELRGQRKQQALQSRGLTPQRSQEEVLQTATSVEEISQASNNSPQQHDTDHHPNEDLFTPSHISPPTKPPSNTSSALAITPATSDILLPPLGLPKPPQQVPVPHLPPSYPLFAHLHSKGYYLSPGLRFGCQYVVYPGDPLRFHSHFLAVAVDWREEIALLDIVGGGRLGTGVKKGFLIGGTEPEKGEELRTFSVEWAVM